MARGFGSTDGTATTDKIVTGHTTLNTLTSWCQWVWLTGAGGGDLGRIFDKDGAGATTGKRFLYYQNGTPVLGLGVSWTGAQGAWTIAAPATGSWHHLCVTYDGGSVNNDPIFYLNNTTPTVTELGPGSGTLETNTGVYHIGNRSDDLRNLNGRVAEFAVWEGTILTAGNVASLYNSGAGARADAIGVTPTTYWRLLGTASPEPNEVGGGSTGTVTGALQQAHPFTLSALSNKLIGLLGQPIHRHGC